VIGEIWSSKCLDEEKTQSGSATFDSACRELAVTKQMNLVLADVVWAQTIGGTVEVLREIFYSVNVSTDSVLSVVATLKFIQHQLPESGHDNLLVTQNLHQ
jgi:hypothetical protein